MIHNDLIIPSINIIHTAVVLRLNLLVPVAQHFKTTARGVFEDDIVSSAYDDDIKKKNYIFGSKRIKLLVVLGSILKERFPAFNQQSIVYLKY